MYFIVPLPINPSADMNGYLEYKLGKTRVFIRDFATVAADDIDALALGA